jgi:hypothetical protein
MPITSTPYTAVYGPLSVAGATCQLWLDAADTTQLVFSSGTNVNTWRDKSGFGNSCSNITAGTTITYPGTQVNGLNTVNFTAGCIRGAFNGASSNTGTDVTIFIVTSETAPNNNIRIFSLTGAASYRDDLADQMLVYGAVGGYLVGYYRGGVYSTTYSVTQNVPFLYTVTQTSGIGSQWFNGGSNTTASITTSAFAVTNYNIGTQYLANQNYTGLMCEVVVYKNLLGDTQRQAIEGYLAQKWGLTANLPPGHPGLTQTLYNSKVYLSRVPLTPQPIYQNFNPKQLTGCQLWLDGADPAGTGSAPANGSTVSTWADKSGNGRNGTSGAGPIYTTDPQGRKCLSFTGTQFLESTVTVPKENHSLIAVHAPTYTNGFNNSGSTLGGNSSLFRFQIPANAGGYIVFPFWYNAPRGYVSNYGTTEGALPDNSVAGTASIIHANIAPQVQYSYKNGIQQGTESATLVTGTTPPLTIGRYTPGLSEYYQGYVYEMIIYSTSLTDTQRQQVEGYLAWKWGLQSSLLSTHPFKNVPPGLPWQASLTSGLTRLPPIVATGGTITFSGAFKIHTFTTVGSTNFTVSQVLPSGFSIEVLVVGGGGGGGGDVGGGGGAGGYQLLTNYLVSQGSYPITIGIGGTGVTSETGSSGGSSSFANITATGGSGGASYTPSTQNGGAAGTGGFSGGTGSPGGGNGGGGGGGGLGGAGVNGAANTGGTGGIGITYTRGTTWLLGGGGGGAANTLGTASFGGGNGGNRSGTSAVNGTPNTGGGGGGGSYNSGVVGANGGSGIVIISYLFS